MSKNSEIRKLRRELANLRHASQKPKEKSEDEKMRDELMILEERKKLLASNTEIAKSQAEGFFGRLRVGFKSGVKQAALNREINATRGYLVTKKQIKTLTEQEKLAELKARVAEKRKKLAINLDEFGVNTKPFKPISSKDIFAPL